MAGVNLRASPVSMSDFSRTARALPPSDRASPVAGPPNEFAGNRAYLVFNGVCEWLGEPAIPDP